ncbi:MAG: (2Fe-2S)-binding protein [Methylococcales bacterium]|nr:(2Fe-2S)-binding protein [Methylococcales bacterium]
MNDMDPDNKQDIVCYCSGTDRAKILALIDKKVTDLESLSRMTGACSGCGACEDLVLEILAEHCQ